MDVDSAGIPWRPRRLGGLIILWLFPKFEEWIDNTREMRTYEVVCPANHEKFEALEAVFRECGLRVKSHKQVKRGDEMICAWAAYGSPKNHDRLTARLFVDAEVREFRF